MKTIARNAWLVATLMPLLSYCSASDFYSGPAYVPLGESGGYLTSEIAALPGSSVSGGIAIGSAKAFYYDSEFNRDWRGYVWSSAETGPIELGDLSDGRGPNSPTQPTSINKHGVVVGSSDLVENGVTPGTRAVRWNLPSTAAVNLGTLGVSASGGGFSEALLVNDFDFIVGISTKYEQGERIGVRAVSWTPDSDTPTEMGILSTPPSAPNHSYYPFALNNHGVAVGAANVPGARPVAWNSNGDIRPLPFIPNGYNGSAYDINDNGVIVGYSLVADSFYRGERAVRWFPNGRTQELGNLGTNNNGETTSRAHAINSDNTAVGFAVKYSGNTRLGERAVRWADGTVEPIELGTLGPDPGNINYSSNALDINSQGVAVGSTRAFSDEGVDLGNKAVAWLENGDVFDLNQLLEDGSGWISLYEARGIDDLGWITGYGVFDPDGPGGQDKYDRMFLVRLPVPTPSSISLLILAIMLPRRQRQKGTPSYSGPHVSS